VSSRPSLSLSIAAYLVTWGHALGLGTAKEITRPAQRQTTSGRRETSEMILTLSSHIPRRLPRQ